MAARHVRIIKRKRIYTILIMVEHRNLYESRAARLCDRGIWPLRLSLPTSESVIRDVKPVTIDICSLGRSAAWIAKVLWRLVPKFELYLYLKT